MRKTVVVILLLLIAILFVSNKWYVKNNSYKLTDAQTNLLQQLGDSALANGEIPVAALLVYNNDIIASGRNDVAIHNNITGHAEINAMANAVGQMGVNAFAKLDKDKLQLITTWEPCDMCQGAIIQYDIRHVIIVKPKSLKHWWQQWKKRQKYQWNKQIATPDTLQDHLFKKHPQYERQKSNL